MNSSLQNISIVSLHYGFSLGGVAQYAVLLEKAGAQGPLNIKTLVLTKPSRFVDRKTLAKLNSYEIAIANFPRFKWIKDAISYVESQKPVAIMAHGFNGYVIAVILNLVMEKKLPILCSYHGSYHAPSYKKKLHEKIYNFIAEDIILKRHAASIVTVCNFSKKFLSAKGVPAERITVIHNGIPVERGYVRERRAFRSELGFDDSHILVGVISRIDEVKGIKYLLAAFNEIVLQNEHIRLVVVGSGVLEAELIKYVCENGLDEKVIFMGYRSDVENFLEALDVYALPSLAEYHSIALLEAMRGGCAIVATDVGGNTESVRDKIEGLIVQPRDSRALADAIRVMASSLDERRLYGEAARKRFLELFTDDIMITKTARWLEKSIKGDKLDAA